MNFFPLNPFRCFLGMHKKLRIQVLSASFTLLFIFPSINSLFSQHQKDSLAIIDVLIKEGAAWRSGDREAFLSCWAARPYGQIIASRADGSSQVTPAAFMQNVPASVMGQGGFAFHSNHRMYIDENSAWVSHDEVSVSKNGQANHSHELRLLEKEMGQWKLIGQSLHFYTPSPDSQKRDTTSYIQAVDIETGKIETILTVNDHFEAPNWHPDNYLIVNSKGKLYTLDLKDRTLKHLNTGFANRNNNDHGYSADGKMLAISHNDVNDPSPKSYKSAVYVLPIAGGEPRRVTAEVPSFWHGWSPDGKLVTYTGERNGEYDIYTISVNGGKEKRLTRTIGLDDGPEYSPDGKYIYLNSFRTGHMQLWRMRANGSRPEQLTFDDYSNWFAHPSPDGKWIAFISYMEDQAQGHPFGKQVKLRLMNLETREIRDLTPEFYGGQGTINVPSWSPDSKKVAFVSYSIRNKTE
ncbi:MAG: hypothetical protein RLZZ241_1080 [Bacteroidota bacterium]